MINVRSLTSLFTVLGTPLSIGLEVPIDLEEGEFPMIPSETPTKQTSKNIDSFIIGDMSLHVVNMKLLFDAAHCYLHNKIG